MAAVTLGDIAQCAGGTEVRHGVAGSVLQHIVGDAHKRVFLAEHLTVFADECESVHIGVHNDAKVVAACLHLVHDAVEVLLQRLRVVCEVAGGFAVDDGVFHSESLEEFGQDNATHAVDGVCADFEVCVAYGFYINEVEGEHGVNVTLVERLVLCVMSEIVDIGVVEIFFFCYFEHLVAIVFRKEFAFAVEQLECVPLAWVVACGDDDASPCARHAYGKFGGRCRCQTNVNDIKTHSHESSTHNVSYHVAGYACVSADNDCSASRFYSRALDESGIGCCELHNVKGVEGVSCLSADSAADAGD